MDRLNVMVVDDSLAYRNIISMAVEGTGKALVECTASNGVIALERLEQRPVDVVLMDIFMPEMDGFETLKKIKEKYEDLPVIMISGGGENGTKLTVKALEYGAMDFIFKPVRGNGKRNMESMTKHLDLLFSQILVNRYVPGGSKKNKVSERTKVSEEAKRPLNRRYVLEREGAGSDENRSKSRPSINTNDADIPRDMAPKTPTINGVDLVVIASSTGGPNAVERVLKVLDKDYKKPILLVQHMPSNFTGFFAKFLDKNCEISVKEGEEGDKILGGRVLVAPGGYHMMVSSAGDTVTLSTSPLINGVRPAADELFESIAQVYRGKRILAVILTGMGSDGTKGVKALKESTQCYCITQSEETSIIYGMPRSVYEAGLSDEVVHIENIGRRIMQISRGTANAR